jgi:hypothetical protein
MNKYTKYLLFTVVVLVAAAAGLLLIDTNTVKDNNNPSSLSCPDDSFSAQHSSGILSNATLARKVLATPPMIAPFFHNTLCFLDEPHVGEPFTLQYTVERTDNFVGLKDSTSTQRISIEMQLPEKASVVSGQTSWNGELNPEDTKTLTLEVRVDEPGYYTFAGRPLIKEAQSGSSQRGPTEGVRDRATKNIEIINSGSKLDSKPVNNWTRNDATTILQPNSHNNEQITSNLEVVGEPKVGNIIEIIYTSNLLLDNKEAPSVEFSLPPNAFNVVEKQANLSGDINEKYDRRRFIRWGGKNSTGQRIRLTNRAKVKTSR